METHNKIYLTPAIMTKDHVWYAELLAVSLKWINLHPYSFQGQCTIFLAKHCHDSYDDEDAYHTQTFISNADHKFLT